MPLTVQDICTDALRELGVLNAVDPPSGEDGALAVLRLNKILDNLNADGNGVYASVLSTFTLTPSLNPHTIGPTGTWVLSQRPQAIEGLSLIVGSTYYPIEIRDEAWYLAQTVPTLSTTIPTDAYYEPAWPNGQLYLYPVPSAADSVRMAARVILASVVLTDTFTLPPGYQDLLTTMLAVDLAAPMRVALSPQTQRNADLAQARVYGNNSRIPRLITADPGMPGWSGTAGFDYQRGY